MNPDLGEIHHYAYVVDDIETTVMRLVDQFGAGPFFVLEEVPVFDVTSRGEQAEFKHGSAFGMCNGAPVELMKIERLAPARASARFDLPRPTLHHLAWAVPPSSLDGSREELERRGLPEYLHAHFGDDVDFTYHDGSASLGHDLEIHADSEGLRGFFAMIVGAAEGWDGSEPIRSPF